MLIRRDHEARDGFNREIAALDDQYDAGCGGISTREFNAEEMVVAVVTVRGAE